MTKAPTKADWTAARDAFFVKQLLEQQTTGGRSEAGWTKEAWKQVLDDFNKKFKLENNVQQLKSRLALLKKQYRFVKTVLEEEGFSWSDALHTVNADDDVWDQYISEHPEAKQFRKICLPLYDELGLIFEGSSAEGRGQISSIRSEPLEDGTMALGTSPQYHVLSDLPLLEDKGQVFGTRLDPIENGTMGSGASKPQLHMMTTRSHTLKGNGVDPKSSSDKEIPLEGSNRNKRPARVPTARRDKRARMSAKDRIADALQSLVLASERLTQQVQTPIVNDNFSYARCLDELQHLQGLEESKFVMAIEALKDEKNAVAFMTLKGPLRLTWLRWICSEN